MSWECNILHRSKWVRRFGWLQFRAVMTWRKCERMYYHNRIECCYLLAGVAIALYIGIVSLCIYQGIMLAGQGVILAMKVAQ